ncbi:MAG: hypothetical protein OXU23_20135 [Candidatus Poribacteria bacterium]|nr:hypothetical protein [Candidatus Poribacteria bacterium]MDE0465617.1 hypothetical protein [Candidatus Poribacteria bacterium]
MNESQVFDEIQRQINKNNLINSCSGEGCTVDMEGVPSKRIIVHVENEFNFQNKMEKRCDRLLFFLNTEKRLVAVPIELKSGKAEESDVVEQLENSLKFAQSIASATSISRTEYCPVLFDGRGIKWSNPRGLKQLRVRFRGKNLLVLRGKCSGKNHLAKILSDSGYL